MYNPWMYNNKEYVLEDDSNIGFIYLIESLIDGRKYIGKKLFYKHIRRKKKRVRVESDWKSYHGSCKELQEDILLHGPLKFKRTILEFCKSKGELNYIELRHQILNDVLLRPEWYNGYVGSRIHRKHVKNVTPLQKS